MHHTSEQSDCSISRRRFLGGVAATAGSLALVGHARGFAGESPPTEKKAPAGKYIDAHVHLGQTWSPRGPLAPEMMLRWMDEHRIARAVVLPLISPEAWYYPITTHWVLEQTAPHRDRLIPFCDVDPRTPNLGGFKGILNLLKRYVDAGAKGLGEHKCGVPIDDPRNLEVFRAAGELGLPVLFHMDSIRNTDKPGLPGLERVLKEVPGSNFIGHAQAWWASISGDVKESEMGGYPRGPVAPGGAIDRLMDNYPNLYAELSAGSGANAVGRDREFGRQFLIRRADRLLFGTDYLAQDQTIVQFDLLDEFDLPEEVQARIFRENARRILKLT
jgi:predicted TIM-barrel fold metal-dependent hydrolase